MGVAEKIITKHGVHPYEVEEALAARPQFRFVERGDVPGEDVYAAFGRSRAGRYLVAYFVHKRNRDALILSARDMSTSERRLYLGHS